MNTDLLNAILSALDAHTTMSTLSATADPTEQRVNARVSFGRLHVGGERRIRRLAVGR